MWKHIDLRHQISSAPFSGSLCFLLTRPSELLLIIFLKVFFDCSFSRSGPKVPVPSISQHFHFPRASQFISSYYFKYIHFLSLSNLISVLPTRRLISNIGCRKLLSLTSASQGYYNLATIHLISVNRILQANIHPSNSTENMILMILATHVFE